MIDTNFNITIKCSTGELVTATWNYSKDHDNSNTWKIEHIDLTLTRNEISYRQRTSIKYNMTISIVPSNAATEGSWECSYSMQLCRPQNYLYHPWKKAHNYEEYGYLISEILLEGKWIWAYSSQTYNISCRKTNGKFKHNIHLVNLKCVVL